MRRESRAARRSSCFASTSPSTRLRRPRSITTIPAATVRRIAREFGEAARIGETITIDGVELPYRPVCVDWAKGTQGHKHGFHNCWPLKLLNIVVGAVNVPGGILSTGAAGKHPHHWWPEGGTDGMLEDGGQHHAERASQGVSGPHADQADPRGHR